MKHNAIFESIVAQCLPLIEAYHDDLLKHDAQSLGGPDLPAEPFLHWTRACGTHLLWLHPAESYPPPSVYLPYLFGQAEREHILKGCVDQASYWTREPVKLVLHFDGRALHKLSGPVRALELAQEYRRSVQSQWNRQEFRSAWQVPQGQRLLERNGNRYLVAENSAPRSWAEGYR